MDTTTLIIVTGIWFLWCLLISDGPIGTLVLAVLIALTLMSGFGALPEWQG